MSIFTGSGVAIVTPFDENGINFDVFGKLIENQIEQGTDAIIVCGTTGEPATMTNDEKESAIRFAVKTVNKRIPVIAGAGSNNTKAAVEASKLAEKLGVDALLIVTPYYNKTTQKGLVEHYKAVADSVHLPIIIYNVPGRTGVNILPSTLKELSNYPNITAVKEASGNISQIAEIARLCPNLDLYSGNDDQVVPILSLGGKGVISVLANIAPKATHDMVIKFLNGDISGSRDLQLKMKPLIDALFIEVNPIPVKTALNLLGYNVGGLRLPLTSMTDEHLEMLKNRLTEYGFKLK